MLKPVSSADPVLQPAPVVAPNAHATNEDFEFAALMEAKNYRNALLDSFSPYMRGSVLEIGAGVGQMSQVLSEIAAVERFVAVEPDERFLPHLRRALPTESILAGTVHNLPPSDWDAIVSINVLEHIEHDEAELAFYRDLLAERRGHLCLFVPARQEIYAPLDKDFGHFRRYSSNDLRAKLDRAGFDIVTARYYNFPGYFAWWLSFRLLRGRRFDAKAVRFYDRAIIPTVYWMERKLCRPPIGQSLLAVVRARPKATDA
jgi:SAM-dependent methyltransferase